VTLAASLPANQQPSGPSGPLFRFTFSSLRDRATSGFSGFSFGSNKAELDFNLQFNHHVLLFYSSDDLGMG
jgi:hypothetical protein